MMTRFSRMLCLVAAALWVGIGSMAVAQTIPEAMDAAIDTQAAARDYVWSALVENADGSVEYYSRNPGTGALPASNTKLFTTAAAVGLLGADYEFRTRVYRGAGTTAGGVFTGTIYLLGEHDPTWMSACLGTGNEDEGLVMMAEATVASLAAQGITQVNGTVEGRGAMFYNLSSTSTGHSSNSTANVSAFNRLVAEAFRTALVNAGLTFTTTTAATGATGFTPDPAWTLLHTHLSSELNSAWTGLPLTMDQICFGVNKPSQNAMADLIMRHIGYKLAGSDTYAQGTARAITWCRDVAGLDTTGLALSDGSGLSMNNRISARQTVDLVRFMTAANSVWSASLPVSCVDGSIAGRLCGTLSGDVHAKTGTLPNGGSVALSGFIDHPTNGQRYFFSMYVNTPGALTGGQAIDEAAARGAIDAALTSFGGRMPTVGPDLLLARAVGSGAVELQWTDTGMTSNGYRLTAAGTEAGPWDSADVGAAYVIEVGRSINTNGQNRGDYSEVGGPFVDSTTSSAAAGMTAGLGSRYVRQSTGPGRAVFTPGALAAGRYRIDVTTTSFSAVNCTNCTVRILDATTTTTARFTLSAQTAANVWRSVGMIDYAPGRGQRVEFSNEVQTTTGTNDRMQIAGLRFVPLFSTQPATAGVAREYRVAAIGPRGVASPGSDVYAVRPSASGAKSVLVVDGYDRWNTQTQAVGRLNHNFGALTTRSIAGRAVDGVANEALLSGAVKLTDYRTVVWIAGEESTTDESFSAAEQAAVSAYLAGGGTLFVSGSEIGWDLDRAAVGPTTADRAFMKSVLHAEYEDGRSDALNDDSSSNNGAGVSGTFMQGVPTVLFDRSIGTGAYRADFPDVLLPAGAGAQVVLTYFGGTANNLGAAVAYDGSAGGGRVVYLGFPFEVIVQQTVRDNVMARSLEFLAPAAEAPAMNGWILH